MDNQIRLRALEQTDLRFIHQLNNNRSIMAYWFEEPYESYYELEELFRKHIHDSNERRFIAEDNEKQPIGLVELVEINTIHRNAEFQIIIAPDYQGCGYARTLIKKALNYAFTILNLHKVYLSVAVNNEKAIHLYEKSGFIEEGHLVKEIFVNGEYCDIKRMYILQETYLQNRHQQ
ncbi:spermidine acetyltransferase [Enterovibrio norvegicus FF-454]|uniref:Spermidine acetyltransferase n=1 Tax=Enterovibrio norvegicus FF-454 TaxID=1185651 RepID=A0A1E5CB83_9GAMM|nr:spermidine N1-acetyltransferase [Enterovibrio norvegicus]OEE62768.1 spermidine acetyltransferase [Enterovibrio norvegicus FF-454]